MIRAYHKTFGVVAEEVESLIAEYSSPVVIQERSEILRQEAEKGYTEPPPTPVRYIEEVEPDTPIYPTYIPLETDYVVEEVEDQWSNPEPEIPVPTGWDEEPYAGTQSDPIVIPEDDNEEEVTSHVFRGKAKIERSRTPVLINSDEEDAMERGEYKSKFVQGTSSIRKMKKEVKEEPRSYFCSTDAMPTGQYTITGGFGDEDAYEAEAAAYKYLDSYFAMTDMTLEANPADPEYKPVVKVKLPGILRRTSRNSWWKPGKYAEK